LSEAIDDEVIGIYKGMAKIFFFSILTIITITGGLTAQKSDLFPIHVTGKAGYIDHSGKIVIPLKFDEAWPFSEDLAPVCVNGDWGYIFRNGSFAIKRQFFEAGDFKGGRAHVGIFWKGRKIIESTVGEYGYIDVSGRILKRQMSRDPEFFFGRKLFQTEGNMPNSRTGYLDETGKVAIKPTFLFGREFSEGLACVLDKQGAGFIDTKGDVQIPLTYQQCGRFSEGFASVLAGGFVGFVDKSGNMVVQPQFQWVPGGETRFSEGVAVVQVGESEKPTNDGSRDVTITAEGNIYAAKSGLFGVIDKTGKFIIPPKYVQIGDFHNGLAWVNLGDSYIIHGDTNRWGYINKQGKIVWKSF